MGRAVKTDYEFDKEKFAELLFEAKGDRTQTEFAKQCQISMAHLNRYLNENKENPPTPMTLKHIADVSQNGVSFEELMRTAGYNPDKYSMPTSAGYATPKLERLCMNEITYALRHCEFEWTSLPPTSANLPSGENGIHLSIAFDWGIRINGNKYFNEWYFEVKACSSEEQFPNCLQNIYGQIAIFPFSPETKVSIVVCDEDVFDQIRNCPPRMFNIYISVILVDTNGGAIREEYLQTALALTDDLQNTYTLTGKNE